MRRSLVAFALVAACSSGRDGPRAGDTATTSDAASVADSTALTDARDAGVGTDAAIDDAVTSTDASPVEDATVATDVALPTDAAPDTTGDATDVDAEGPGPWPAACKLEGPSDTVPIPEASGALFLDDTRILIVADSGNAGQAIIYDLAKGTAVDLTLPLGQGAGDDVENLARGPDGRIWGLTSAGFLRAWRADGDGFALDLGPTPVAPEGDWLCDPNGVNCGANFEGLCLHPAPVGGGCAGWAASKAKGVIVCLVAEGQAYRVDPTRTIAVAAADQLSDCAFEPVAPHRLVVAGNVLSGSLLWEIDVVTHGAAPFAELGAPNQEAIAIGADRRIHSFGDLQNLTPDSPHLVLRCP